MPEKTRKEHLEECKKKALAQVEKGDMDKAYAVMVDGLAKHEETRNHGFLNIFTVLFLGKQLQSKEQMTYFIKGFN